MTKILAFALSIFTFLSVLVFSSTESSARVDMLPHLLVIEDRVRSSELIVLNLDQKPSQFTLQEKHYRQTETGAYIPLDGPISDLFDPREVVRISPKEFRLEDSGRQKVRISVRRPADLPDGEYRFHLLAKGRDAPDANGDVEQDVSVGVQINLGISIPVIVRQGKLTASGGIQDFNLVGGSKTESGQPELEFLATREGNKSTLGRVDVYWQPQGGNAERIGFVTNFNLFTEITQRRGAVPLDKLPSGPGSLRVVYSDTLTEEIYDEVILDQ